MEHPDHSLDPLLIIFVVAILFLLCTLSHLHRGLVRTLQLLPRILELDACKCADSSQFLFIKDVFVGMLRRYTSFYPSKFMESQKAGI